MSPHSSPSGGRLLSRGTLLAIATGCWIAAACSSAGPGATPGSATPAPGRGIAPALDAITEADIRRDMFALAGDAMRGRLAGTIDEIRATGWVAERAREAGLSPLGEDDTWFQWWSLRRSRLSEESQVTVGGRSLRLWKDVVALNNRTTNLDVPIVFVADTLALAGTDVRGKAVAMEVPAIQTQPEDQYTLRGNFQGAISAEVRARASAIDRAGASAAILVSGTRAFDPAFDLTASIAARGTYGLDSAGAPPRPFVPLPATPQSGRAAGGGGPGGGGGIPSFWLRQDMLTAVKAPEARLAALMFQETFTYPSGNVIGVVRGTDPRLANEYVVFSAHQDHDGVRAPVAGDSIWNGADDNASASVAILAAARAFVKHPAPRPILFVWQGAEERGLLGSRWFVSHPTVPRSQLIAVLNADMIGRNPTDSAALLGSTPPHKNSNTLVAAALRVNNELTRFKLDTLWDKPTHPQGFYFRSDHLPYARAGIPAIFFTTTLHPDYHTPRDDPGRIDYPKLTKIARWMYATGWLVAAAPQRPDLIPDFKLER